MRQDNKFPHPSAPDPHITRMAQLLRLDYYDMDIPEMERRLAAKSSGDADVTLDFNRRADGGLVRVPRLEGEEGAVSV